MGTHGVQDHSAEYLVSSFSGGGGGGGGNASPLPVELVNFTATPAANHTAQLDWTTASELNNSHFILERSYNGRDFEEVTYISGNGTTSEMTHYNFEDYTINPNQFNVFYRLRQVDFDGTEDLSSIKLVRFDQEVTNTSWVKLYPNPRQRSGSSKCG